MLYWNNIPFQINHNKNIMIIDKKLSINAISNYPREFKLVSLNMTHLDEIYYLINNHYICDNDNVTRLTFSKSFLYWYLKEIPSDFIIGLIYGKKLIGLITCLIIELIVHGEKIKTPYINFLCIQRSLRHLKLSNILMDEMKRRILSKNIFYCFFCNDKKWACSFVQCASYVIPINYPKLHRIHFLTEKIDPLRTFDYNPLQIMDKNDAEQILTKLSMAMDNLLIKPYFTKKTLLHYLAPKKNIVYSFVIKNVDGQVTDFVSVYKHYLYCIDTKEMVSVAKLAFYYHHSVDQTTLIEYLLDKLDKYGFDQLIFYDMYENNKINITKFSMKDKMSYYFGNMAMPQTKQENICFFPI